MVFGTFSRFARYLPQKPFLKNGSLAQRMYSDQSHGGLQNYGNRKHVGNGLSLEQLWAAENSGPNGSYLLGRAQR